MRPLRNRLQQARQRLGAPWEVLERDYLLSWVLAGIDRVPALGCKLVFKGGTALRKCYSGDYRFSEDLDFSGLDALLPETPWRALSRKRVPLQNACWPNMRRSTSFVRV